MEGEINVNERHVGLRTLAFFLALFLAVGAFGLGIRGIRARAEGCYTVEPKENEEVIRYAKRVRLDVYLSGSSTEIRTAQQRLAQTYGELLLRYVRLLDPWETFEGSANLALLNRSPGETVRLDPVLLPLLSDALERTEEGSGYSLFAGPFYREWEMQRYLEDPLPSDPRNDPGAAERFSALAALASDTAAFRLVIEDAAAGLVRLEISPDARSVLDGLEYEGPVLDLNLLGEAYLLRLLGEGLEDLGCTRGYLSGAEGTVLALSDNRAGEYCLYGRNGETVEPAALTPAEAGTAFCLLRAFPLPGERYGYYALTGAGEPETPSEEGKTLYRHPNVPCTTVPQPGNLDAAAVLDPAGDPVEARWRCLLLFFSLDSSDLILTAEGGRAESERIPMAWTLADGAARTVWVNTPGADRFAPPEEFDWRLLPAASAGTYRAGT